MRISDWSSDVCSSDLTNQLAWKLRQDERVIVHEQTSARILTPAHIPEPLDLIVCDASFIGLAKVLEVPLGFARDQARAMVLVKPQFEAGRGEVGKGGVVRDPTIHARVCDEAAAWFAGQEWRVEGVTQSPIRSEEHPSELQSLMRISYAVFCLH